MRSKSWLVRWAQWLLGPPFSCDVFCEVAYGARVSRSTPRRSRLYLPSCCPVEVDLERCQTPVRHPGQRCRVVRPSLVAGMSSENQRSRGPGTRVFSDSGTAFVIVVRRCAATKLIRGLAERMGAKHGRFYVNPPFGRLSSASVPIRGGRPQVFLDVCRRGFAECVPHKTAPCTRGHFRRAWHLASAAPERA